MEMDLRINVRKDGDIPVIELEGEVDVALGGRRRRSRVVETYDEGGKGLSIVLGSAGYFEVAKRRGSAARELHAGTGDRLTLMPKAVAGSKKR